MISIRIKDIKNFMSKLLVGDTFDFLLVKDITLTTYNTFTIDGHINKRFFNEDELSELDNTDFSSWTKLKPFCYELIKGTKTPQKFKITFCLSSKQYDKIIEKSSAPLAPENIDGLYIHFQYENDNLTAVVASSLNIFTMDKSLDKYWDESIKSYLVKNFDVEIL